MQKNEQKHKQNGLRLKVCGLRDFEQIQAITELGVDFLGFIFYPPSPRDVASNWSELSKKLSDLPDFIKKVGVFVNPSVEDVWRFARANEALTTIQLHGQESPEFCLAIQKMGYQVMKVFSGNALPDQATLDAYKDSIDYYLFDHRGKAPGGNGLIFDWSTLLDLDIKKPFLLSGGLRPESAPDILEFQKKWNAKRNPEFFYGLDINSGFENAPADKNIEAIRGFIKEIQFVLSDG